MRVLFLSTWFPYPPDQGSKIRAYHLIRALAQRHEVALVSFADTAVEPSWLAHMGSLCPRVEVVERNPFARDRLRLGLSRLSARPSGVVATYSPEMSSRVRDVAREWRPQVVVALTYLTARYALTIGEVPRVIDVDNHITRMLYEAHRRAETRADRCRLWLAWTKFRRYERWLLRQFDRCLVVSRRDWQAVAALISAHEGQVAIVPNGVDTAYHHPGLAAPLADTLIYNGALTYEANYDAMDFFLREIFPLVRARVPAAALRITGATGTAPIAQLALHERVSFTGYLADVRPAVAGSWACVVPLRIGGGARVKILEAMALGTPVVSTSKGAEGLDVLPGEHLLLADTPGEFAAQTVRLLGQRELRESLASRARRLVVEKYDWADVGRQFCSVVQETASVGRRVR